MPELPEVETIRRGLSGNVCNKQITNVEVRKIKMVRGKLVNFKKILIGAKFLRIDRVGKLLIFVLSRPDTYMLLHLKMTGQLIFENKKKRLIGGHNFPEIDETKDKLPNKYSHIIFHFRGGEVLYFNDLRQFGYVELVSGKQLEKVKAKYGLEPLTKNFTWQNFEKVLDNKKGRIKPILLDQSIFSGIGNIYADEICFYAGVRPSRLLSTLKDAERKKLFAGAKHIIALAIKHRGTTFSDYRDHSGAKGNYSRFLKVYDRSGKTCLRCHQGIIEKIKVGGRGTHFCPECQK